MDNELSTENTLFLFLAANAPMKMCIVWMPLKRDNVWQFIMLLGVPLILNPFICFFGCSHPSLLSRQAQTVIFSKIAITTKSPSLHFVPYKCEPIIPPLSKIRAKLQSFSMSQPFTSIPVTSVTRIGCFDPRCTWHCHSTSGNYTGLPCILFTLVLCHRHWFK